MKAKTMGTIALLAFVAVSVGYLIVSETNGGRAADGATNKGVLPGAMPAASAAGTGESPHADAGAPPAAPASTEPSHKVIAYYFHNTMRCVTCLKIEKLAEQALRTELAHAFDNGALEWHVLNMEEPAYQHFAIDYGLVTSSLVLVDMQGGEQRAWTNMQEVWQLVDDESAFRQYVVNQARSYLEQ